MNPNFEAILIAESTSEQLEKFLIIICCKCELLFNESKEATIILIK